MYKKQEIRDFIKNEFKKYSSKYFEQAWKNTLSKLLYKLPYYRTIFCFISSKDEIDTRIFIDKSFKIGKTILVPKIINDEIKPVEIKSLDVLNVWTYGILEPVSNNIYNWKIDLAIVPGLAFTKFWKRIWKWKWYYDRFFAKNKDIYKIWICYDFQVLDDFETNGFDINMDEIITN